MFLEKRIDKLMLEKNRQPDFEEIEKKWDTTIKRSIITWCGRDADGPCVYGLTTCGVGETPRPPEPPYFASPEAALENIRSIFEENLGGDLFEFVADERRKAKRKASHEKFGWVRKDSFRARRRARRLCEARVIRPAGYYEKKLLDKQTRTCPEPGRYHNGKGGGEPF